MSLSVIIQARNNAYGLAWRRRTVMSLNHWGEILRQGDEIVFVDNLSDNGRTLPEEVADGLSSRVKSMLRVLRLSPETGLEIEQKYGEKAQIAVLDEIARNVGIRRSNGDWIVSSNADNLVSCLYPLLDHLDRRCLYSAWVTRVPAEVWTQSAAREVLHWTARLPRFSSSRPMVNPWEKVGKAGDFLLAGRSLWYRLRGFEERMAFRWGAGDANVTRKYYNLRREPIVDLYPSLAVLHLEHATEGHPFFGAEETKNSYQGWVVNFEGPTRNDTTWGEYPVEEVCL